MTPHTSLILCCCWLYEIVDAAAMFCSLPPLADQNTYVTLRRSVPLTLFFSSIFRSGNYLSAWAPPTGFASDLQSVGGFPWKNFNLSNWLTKRPILFQCCKNDEIGQLHLQWETVDEYKFAWLSIGDIFNDLEPSPNPDFKVTPISDRLFCFCF